MNRNYLFGLLGITLLTFLGAFILGRWSRPAQTQSSFRLSATAGSAYAAELSNASENEANRLLAAMRTEAYQEEEETDEARNSSTLAKKLKAESKTQSGKPNKQIPLASAGPASATDTARRAFDALSAVVDTTPNSALDIESITPKTVVAKDVVAIEERHNYAAQLPSVLLQKGMEVKVNVVGEQAEVIVMSSPSFDAQSKDSVIKQVCIDLKALGFKRVHLTDGKDYTMHFGL